MKEYIGLQIKEGWKDACWSNSRISCSRPKVTDAGLHTCVYPWILSLYGSPLIALVFRDAEIPRIASDLINF